MRAVVVSDTHDRPERVLAFLDTLGEEYRGGLLIHLGDIVSPFTLASLAGKAAEKGLRFVGVYGNNCGEKLGLARVAQSVGADLAEGPRTLEAGGRRLLLFHGYGSPENTRELAVALADSGRWDAVLYGHTHMQHLEYRAGRLVLNPGEAAGVLQEPSLALLELDTLRVRFVKL